MFWHNMFWILYIVFLVIGIIGGWRAQDKNYAVYGGSLITYLMLGFLAWLAINFPH